MATTTIKGLNSSETTFFLRLALGPLYSWDMRLADMRRGKVKQGPILLPIARAKTDRVKCPHYSANDIRDFVLAYKDYDTQAKTNVKPQIEILEVENDDRRHWRYRNAKVTPLS
jgi:hypothetical protein